MPASQSASGPLGAWPCWTAQDPCQATKWVASPIIQPSCMRLAVGLLWIAGMLEGEVVLVCYDSEYARNMAGGLWKPRANWEAVFNAKSACSLAEAQCTLQWVQVDSHTGDELNDRADGLAALGGNGWTKALDDLPSETRGALRDLPGDQRRCLVPGRQRTRDPCSAVHSSGKPSGPPPCAGHWLEAEPPAPGNTPRRDLGHGGGSWRSWMKTQALATSGASTIHCGSSSHGPPRRGLRHSARPGRVRMSLGHALRKPLGAIPRTEHRDSAHFPLSRLVAAPLAAWEPRCCGRSHDALCQSVTSAEKKK